MSTKDEAFYKELLAVFQVEAAEHLNDMADGLLELEKSPQPEEPAAILEAIFRNAHSLKGSARAVDRTDIAALCQSLEDVFAAWKGRGSIPETDHFDVLFRVIDRIEKRLSESESTQSAGVPSMVQDLERLLADVEDRNPAGSPPEDCVPNERATGGVQKRVQAEEEGAAESLPSSTRTPADGDGDSPSTSPADPHATVRSDGKNTTARSHTVRISTAKLDALLLQAEELLAVKLATNQRAADLKEILGAFPSWEKAWRKLYPEVRAAHRALDLHPKTDRGAEVHLENLLRFLDWNLNFVQSLRTSVASLERSATEDYRSLSAMVDHLLEDMKRALMLPISSLLDLLPRMVRDLSREHNKDVRLEIQGGDVEIDRRILEQIKDPLIHLVRNCIDHGLEPPEERRRLGKSAQGSLSIAISHVDSNQVQMLITDDGKGIDLDEVRNAAVKRGVLSQEAAGSLTRHENLMLIFQSGLSTSPIITDLSGRGLGMTIVEENIGKLGGRIAVETAPNQGTTFRIHLPVTLATFRGVLLRVDGRTFLVPTTSVERVVRINPENIKTVGSRETVTLDGRVVSLVRLRDVLEFPPETGPAETPRIVPVVVLGNAEKSVAFQVDEVLYEQEVLVKGLGEQLARVRNVAGATILGSGEVVPILHVRDLLVSARRAGRPAQIQDASGEAEQARKTILVVEDSITTRTLLKNVLQAVGFAVHTAVDGVDAFTALRSASFDLVVSDVEMPRMDGFDLTRRIREDKKLADTPVILVTSLESRQDRERGIDVGADAYVLKSGFDQATLLQTIQKLI